jgi:hypothetical protein
MSNPKGWVEEPVGPKTALWIQELKQENARLRDALKPFANAYDADSMAGSNVFFERCAPGDTEFLGIEPSDFHRAWEALNPKEGKE